MKTTLLAFLGCAFTASLLAAPTADEIMSAAQAKAGRENKAIYVHFSASWCGWCKRLDAFLESPQIKPVFEKHFVPVKLIVQENDQNKALENAGGTNWLAQVGGPEGLPFSAFLDAKGKLLVNSKPNATGGNIGYPAQSAEIDWFLSMLKKAAPKNSDAELKIIETALREKKTN